MDKLPIDNNAAIQKSMRTPDSLSLWVVLEAHHIEVDICGRAHCGFYDGDDVHFHTELVHFLALPTSLLFEFRRKCYPRFMTGSQDMIVPHPFSRTVLPPSDNHHACVLSEIL